MSRRLFYVLDVVTRSEVKSRISTEENKLVLSIGS